MQTPPEEYEVVVLGSGEAGKYIAWTQAKKGMRAIVVERKYIGGSCPNIACLPSKNMIHSAKVASYFWRSEEFGITKDNTQIQMPVVRDRKRKMVDGLVQMHIDNFKASGAELLMGSGRFVGPKTIEVTLPDGGSCVFRKCPSACLPIPSLPGSALVKRKPRSVVSPIGWRKFPLSRFYVPARCPRLEAF